MRKTCIRLLRAAVLVLAALPAAGGVALADEMGMGMVASGAAVTVVAPLAFLLSAGLLGGGVYFMVTAVRGRRDGLD